MFIEIFVFCVLFHVSLGHFVLVLLAFVVFSLVFQYLAKRLDGKNVSEMINFVSSRTYNHNSVNADGIHSHFLIHVSRFTSLLCPSKLEIRPFSKAVSSAI